ncbi:MAG: hypothetical protein AAGI11_05025 [Pseudomonadota bacterium]
MMTDTPPSPLTPFLQPGEELLWTGEPDREVMLKTLGKRKQGLFVPLVAAAVVGIFVWANWETVADLEITGLPVSADSFLPLVGAAAFIGLIFFLRRGSDRGHVESLFYGITDQRVLIVRKAELYEAVTPDKMQWVKLEDRLGAKGHHDIIWDKRRIPGSQENPTPLQIEQSRIGFKALADGPAVMAQIEAWRDKHRAAADQVARAALEALESDPGHPRLAHPRLSFSLPTPAGWEVTVRIKKVVFGKTGVDLNADKWTSPERTGDWNVIRLRNVAANAEVMLEVAESKPVATYDSMADPSVPGFIKKVMQVVDSDKHVTLNGLDGFRVDVALSGAGQTEMALGQSSDLVKSTMRQYVFHDGMFQYYMTATWPSDNDTQAATCQAIMDRVSWCPTLTA